MTIERADPIPVGVYWIDVVPEALEAWHDWQSSNRGKVRTLSTSTGEDGLTWILFRCDVPVRRWPASARLGLPTVAPFGEATEPDDTIQAPESLPYENPLETIGSAARKVATAAVLCLVGYGLISWFSRRR